MEKCEKCQKNDRTATLISNSYCINCLCEIFKKGEAAIKDYKAFQKQKTNFADLDLSKNRGWPKEIAETAWGIFSENLSQSVEKSKVCHLANFKSRVENLLAVPGEKK